MEWMHGRANRQAGVRRACIDTNGRLGERAGMRMSMQVYSAKGRVLGVKIMHFKTIIYEK